MLCRPSGIEFTAPLPHDVELKIGDVATFVYDNYSQWSIPVNPTILRLREDITWKDILFDYQRNSSSPSKELNGLFFASRFIYF